MRWLAWSAVALEGYDLVVLGVVIPVLLDDPAFGLTAASATTVTTVGLLGVMVGALAVGPVADVVGRRRTMIACVVAFSRAGAACALAPNADGARRAALPRRRPARRRAAGRARDGQRARAARPRRQGHDDPHDRLPRRRGRRRADRRSLVIAASAGESMFVLGALPARRAGAGDAAPKLPLRRPRRPAPATRRTAPQPGARACSATASPCPRSPSGSPRSWACCWSTA